MSNIKKIPPISIFSDSGKPEPEETYKTFNEGREGLDLIEKIKRPKGGEKKEEKKEEDKKDDSKVKEF